MISTNDLIIRLALKEASNQRHSQDKKLLLDIVAIIILTVLGIILVKTQIVPRLGGFYR